MSDPGEASQALLTRAFSYLRLSGMDAAQCCRAVEGLAGALADTLTRGTATEADFAALWAAFIERSAPVRAPGGAEEGAPTLPILRGSIGYARFGR
ncbi:MAG: hypothetical protein KDF24_01935 [Rhodocyclaceae bacterium]|nr:hypothetical protein [Rhodocyclaceae bacterium]MCB1961918.1 hypothetical protein [Rhodocyclaceae bacterium]